MQSTMSKRGQAVLPVRADPVEAFRGQGKGGAAKRLVADRKLERSTEQESLGPRHVNAVGPLRRKLIPR